MSRLVTHTNLEVFIDVDSEVFYADAEAKSKEHGGGELPFPYVLASKRGGLMAYVAGVCHTSLGSAYNFEVDTLVTPFIVTVYQVSDVISAQAMGLLTSAFADLSPWVTVRPLQEES